MRPKWFLSLLHEHKPCTYLALRLRLSPNRPKSSLIWPMSPQSSIGVLKTISMPMVCLSHLGHLSCTKINTISKQTKRSFHLTHITYKFHRVRPKRFSSLLHVRYKPCTNLVWRLTLSPNGPKRASIWPTHLTAEVPMVHSAQTMLLSCTKFNIIPTRTKWTSTWPTSPRSSIGSTQNDFQAYYTFGTNGAPILRQD
jgi:hypothetical protein